MCSVLNYGNNSSDSGMAVGRCYARTNILSFCNKTNEKHYFFKFIFGIELSDGFSVHHQESSTVHTAIGICRTGYADCLLASIQHNLYVLLCVQC